VSLRLDARELDHLRPFLGLVADEFAVISRRARNYHTAEIHKPRLKSRIGQAGTDLFIEPVDNRLRSVSRRTDTVPSARFITRNEFGQRRNIRERRRTCRRSDGQSAEFALTYKPDRARQIIEGYLHPIHHQIGVCKRKPAVGHIENVGLGHQLEQFSGHMHRRAVSSRCIGELAGICFSRVR